MKTLAKLNLRLSYIVIDSNGNIVFRFRSKELAVDLAKRWTSNKNENYTVKTEVVPLHF